MEKEILKVLSNRPIAKDVYEMVLEGSTKSITAPGQFINLAIEGLYLRRPISVCDYDENIKWWERGQKSCPMRRLVRNLTCW